MTCWLQTPIRIILGVVGFITKLDHNILNVPHKVNHISGDSTTVNVLDGHTVDWMQVIVQNFMNGSEENIVPVCVERKIQL